MGRRRRKGADSEMAFWRREALKSGVNRKHLKATQWHLSTPESMDWILTFDPGLKLGGVATMQLLSVISKRSTGWPRTLTCSHSRSVSLLRASSFFLLSFRFFLPLSSWEHTLNLSLSLALSSISLFLINPSLPLPLSFVPSSNQPPLRFPPTAGSPGNVWDSATRWCQAEATGCLSEPGNECGRALFLCNRGVVYSGRWRGELCERSLPASYFYVSSESLKIVGTSLFLGPGRLIHKDLFQ